MSKKWITITLSDGSMKIQEFDSSETAELVFSPPIQVTKIIISDQPENPLARAFGEHLTGS